MLKALARIAFLLGVLCVVEVRGQDMPPNPANHENEAAAVARAKQTLAKTWGIAESEIELVRAEARTWNDSSLGCGKPGNLAMQVLTPGYDVTLRAGGQEHSVHVSGNSAIVCDRHLPAKKHLRASRARGVDSLIQLAKEDLAKQLNIDASEIRVAGMQPEQWPDTGLECPISGEPVQPGPVPGYRLSLRFEKRVYTYHTDMRSVRPCPPIASS